MQNDRCSYQQRLECVGVLVRDEGFRDNTGVQLDLVGGRERQAGVLQVLWRVDVEAGDKEEEQGRCRSQLQWSDPPCPAAG